MYYECDCGAQCSWETDNDYCGFGKKEKGRYREGNRNLGMMTKFLGS